MSSTVNRTVARLPQMYHDIDFARRELLTLLGEHNEFRVRVQPDYEDTGGITNSSILVSYTCNVRPSLDAQQEIRSWVDAGGRWIALHGTNSALDVLGHCRGHYDMVPVVDYYPTIERGSWEQPAYYELLRRSLRWARGDTA